MIDKNNYHLFQPLLYQVATAALSPAQIAPPIRAILSKQKNCITELGEVIGIDTTRKIVLSHAGATHIRRLILQAFEQAETSEDENLRQALMTFTVVGAGPTGVEMAGAIAELARHTLKGEFRRIDPASARIILAEAGPRVLYCARSQTEVFLN